MKMVGHRLAQRLLRLVDGAPGHRGKARVVDLPPGHGRDPQHPLGGGVSLSTRAS
jgi:hypothetical protein